MTRTPRRFYAETDAANVLGLPLDTFRTMVRSGALPGPVPAVGLFDMKALHAACDRLSGLAPAGTEKRAPAKRAKGTGDAEKR